MKNFFVVECNNLWKSLILASVKLTGNICIINELLFGPLNRGETIIINTKTRPWRLLLIGTGNVRAWACGGWAFGYVRRPKSSKFQASSRVFSIEITDTNQTNFSIKSDNLNITWIKEDNFLRYFFSFLLSFSVFSLYKRNWICLSHVNYSNNNR